MKNIAALLLLSGFLFSCGEESLTVNTVSEEYNASNTTSYSLSTCSQFTFRKPPVDILYVVDNTGSTLSDSFENIKSQIKNTVSTISDDFDYHIYVAPLVASNGDSISGYPVIISDTDSVTSLASLNQSSANSLTMFADASGNNTEYGFERVQNLIKQNRSNGIFRDEANTIVVLISNGDDTEAYKTIQGNKVYDSSKFNEIKTEMTDMISSLSAVSFRFISLVPHSACNSGWTKGTLYKNMSSYIYSHQGFSDNSSQDSLDLCSGNYSSLFTTVNNSIQAVVEGHKYDHWKISSASESDIEASDITVTKVLADGSTQTISESTSNGFEYLGYKSNQLLTYEPSDANEKASGLMIKLYGNARVSYPECIIAKTRTPTEYFGYIALPREPDTTTITVSINGTNLEESSTNGWSYVGWKDTQNIKVAGPTNAATTPAISKSGYFIKLNGDAIFTNGDSITVYYKPASE